MPKLVFDNIFKKIKELGEGASGLVWLVEIKERWNELEVGTKLAIKEYKAEVFSKEEKSAVIRRRIREATSQSKINHPNVIQIYDTKDFWIDDQPTFIVMEYLGGHSLEEYIKDNPLSPTEIFDIATQLTAGLACLHENGIIHRDLKPANIQICPDNRVVILDLGVFKPEDEKTFTSSQAFLGTLRFSSPEWLFREECTMESDIYSLGSILYYMLFRKHIFSEINLYSRLVIAIKDEDLKIDFQNENVALAFLTHVVSTMLDKSPSKRPTLHDISIFLQQRKESQFWKNIREKVVKTSLGIDLEKEDIKASVAELYDLDFIDKAISSNNLGMLCNRPPFVKILFPKFSNEIIRGYLSLSNDEKNRWIVDVFSLIHEEPYSWTGDYIEFGWLLSEGIKKNEKNKDILTNNNEILDDAEKQFNNMLADIALENP